MQKVIVDLKGKLSKSNEFLNELTKLRSEISFLRLELQQERKERKSLERQNARLQEKMNLRTKISEVCRDYPSLSPSCIGLE